MKPIYDFERHDPPALNENMLRGELERRRLRWQTALIAAAGILAQVVLVMLGFLTMEEYPLITAVCLSYVVLSATGSGVLAVVCTRKGGFSL